MYSGLWNAANGPIRSGDYIDLPNFLCHKHAIINVQNRDQRSFGYAILSALNPGLKNPPRPQCYEDLFEENGLDQLQYPVSLNQIPAVEDRLDVRLNVFSFYDRQGRERYTLYISKKPASKRIDLLMWNDHYSWITSLNSFLADICGTHKTFWCKKCLDHFASPHTYQDHKQHCSKYSEPGEIIGKLKH